MSNSHQYNYNAFGKWCFSRFPIDGDDCEPSAIEGFEKALNGIDND